MHRGGGVKRRNADFSFLVGWGCGVEILEYIETFDRIRAGPFITHPVASRVGGLSFPASGPE